MSYYDKNSKQLRYRFINPDYRGYFLVGYDITKEANFNAGDKLILTKEDNKTFSLRRNKHGYGNQLTIYTTKDRVTPKYLKITFFKEIIDLVKLPKKDAILVFPHVVCSENPEEPYIKFWLSERAAKE